MATPATAKKGKSISTTMMAMMIIVSILSLRGFASQAEYGYTSIFYYLFAALVFLIPYSLVCAELASTWTGSGGVFRWVSEGLGPRWGWAAIYLDWMMIVIWLPAVLMFVGNALAFIGGSDNLAENKLFAIAVLLIVYWGATLITFRGIHNADRLSTAGGWIGTLIPIAILIVLGIIYICTGNPNQIPHTSFWPDFSHWSNIVLAASIFLFFAGTELQAVHIQHMPNPRKQFPVSVLVSTAVILVCFIGGTLAIGFVIPQGEIGLLASLFTAFDKLWSNVGAPWLGNAMALFIAVGTLAQISVNISGPSTGLLAVGRAGYLPPLFQRVNSHDVQVPILLVQGGIVTVLGVVLLVLPSVQSSYQILSQMSTIMYLFMILMVYGSFVVLRYAQPDKPRGFRVPGGKVGMWTVAIIGSLGSILALSICFLPPSQIETGDSLTYILILAGCVVVFTSLPFIVYSRRKSSWKSPDSHFEPFDWQTEGRKPWQKA